MFYHWVFRDISTEHFSFLLLLLKIDQVLRNSPNVYAQNILIRTQLIDFLFLSKIFLSPVFSLLNLIINLAMIYILRAV